MLARTARGRVQLQQFVRGARCGPGRGADRRGDYKIRIPWTALGVLREFGGPAAGDGFGYLPEAGEAERRAAGERIAAWWRSRPRDFAVPLRARFEDPLFAAGVDREIGILGRYKFLEMDRSRRALILLGSPALPRLTAALVVAPEADPSGQQRIGVAQVLQEIGRPEAAGPLRTALARAEIPPVRIIVISRFKGLGEMNPEQLWATTMNPETRTILQVTIENAADADRTFSILMGDEVEPRREFIEKNAKYVRNLDV